MIGRQAGVEDVPPGYKRTEVGVIPEDWKCTSLGAVVNLLTGFPFPSSGYADSGILLLRGSNVKRGILDWEEEITKYWPYVTPDISRYELREGDLVIAMDGALVGRSYAVVSAADLPSLLLQRVARLRSSQVHQDLLVWWIASDSFVQYVDSVKTHTAIPHISPRDICDFTIVIPTELPEQRTIAAALSDADGLIGALDALIEKKRAIKQAAMQQLLTGKKRLPGFSGEWRTTTLGETADIRNGATPSTQIPAYWNGQIPWCTPTDITGTPGKYLLETERSITVEGLENCAASLLPVGALLLCSRATIGEIKIAASPVCTNQGFKSLVCKSGISNEFLYYLLLTLKPQMIERAIGSTFLEIGKRDVASIKLRIPEHSEQTAIATVLSDMDAEIAALEHRREKAKQIKQGMMQQLLTGRIRLPSAGRVSAQ